MPVTRQMCVRAARELFDADFESLPSFENQLRVAQIVAIQEVAENLSLIHDELRSGRFDRG